MGVGSARGVVVSGRWRRSSPSPSAGEITTDSSPAAMFVHVFPGQQGWQIIWGDYGLAAGVEDRPGRLGVRRADVGELAQQVVVRLEAGRGDLAVGQPGEAHAVDV